MIKKIFMKKTFLVLVTAFIFVSFGVFAQNINVTGKITDESGNPLPGVTIVQEGTTNGTVSDSEGNYSIEVPGSSTLVFSFIGMATVSEDVNNRSTINVVMTQDVVGIEEVVAIGYGSVKKVDLSGSVSTLKNENLESIDAVSLEHIMQGRLSGVSVSQSDAGPGGGIKVNIRGSSSLNMDSEPLYVIDGIPISGGNEGLPGAFKSNVTNLNTLNFLDPSQIESIQVLKDASATAIYGARGANGVVIIETKSGTKGKAKINFGISYDFATNPAKYDMLGGKDFAMFANAAILNKYVFSDGLSYEEVLDNNLLPYTPSQIEQIENGTTPVYDWQDMIMQTGVSKNYSLNVSGGDEKTTYSVGLSYYDELGVVKNSDYNRIALNANLDRNVNDWFTINNSLKLSKSDADKGNAGNISGADHINVILKAATYPALLGPDEPMPSWSQDIMRDDPFHTLEYIDERRDYVIMDRLNFNINPISDLTLQVRLGFDLRNYRRGQYYPSTTYRGRTYNTPATHVTRTSLSLINEEILTYDKTFGNHKLNAMVAYSFQEDQSEQLFGESAGFTVDNTTWMALNSGSTIIQPSNNLSKSRISSYLGRFIYNYYEKYLLTLSIRADGSSRMGENNKWGYFPSGAFAWRISEEEFLKDNTVISNMKLRISGGQTGNANIPNYRSLAALGTTPVSLDGSTIQTGFFNSLMPNPDLKWETSQEINFGMDWGFNNNKINIAFDYYIKNTKDLLQAVQIPTSTGYNSQWQNRGEVKNSGFELNLDAIILSDDLKWDINLNGSTNKNEIISLGYDDEEKLLPLYQGVFYAKEGYSLGDMFTWEVDDVIKTQEEADAYEAETGYPYSYVGNYKYIDQNNDGKLDDDDRVKTGTSNPDLIFGMTNNFSYKNLFFSIMLRGVTGNDVYNITGRNQQNRAADYNIRKSDWSNIWLPEIKDSNGNVVQEGKPDGTIHMPWLNGVRPGSTKDDSNIEDGSYLRIQNVTLGYNLRPSIKEIQEIRLFFGINNLYTFTKYSGLNPEVTTSEIGYLRGYDSGAYPITRDFKIGVNVIF